MHCNRRGCRLETLFAGRWGTVCGRGFAAAGAGVLCRAFGYARGAVRRAFGGGDTAPPAIWLAGVRCAGLEGDVGDCDHAPWGETSGCTHRDDVGLCCIGPHGPARGVRRGPSDWPLCPAAAAPFARLTGCDYARCRLEIEHDGEWGAVCAAGFSDAASRVVCASLGFRDGGAGGAVAASVARPAGLLRPGAGRVWLASVRCAGSETNVRPAPSHPFCTFETLGRFQFHCILPLHNRQPPPA